MLDWAVNILGSFFDYIFALYIRYIIVPDKKFRFFRDGFGDLNSLIKSNAYIHSLADKSKTIPDLTVVMKHHTSDESGDPYDECSFTSPAAFFLPSNICTAYFQLLKPPKGTQVKGVIIVLPHAGDEWYENRKSILAAGDMINNGYVGVITMAPFYGKRRGENQSKHFIRSVALWQKSILAAAIETAALVRWAHKTFPGTHVCVAGASQGGAIAAFTACIAQDPISIASVVGFATQCPMLSTIMTLQFDWQALMADRPGCSRSAICDELFMISSCTTISSISIISQARSHSVLARAVCVNAQNDAYVNLNEYYELASALRLMSGNNVSIEWVTGGHIAAIFDSTRLMNHAILDAFNHDKKFLSKQTCRQSFTRPATRHEAAEYGGRLT
jgi:hypothetical protein